MKTIKDAVLAGITGAEKDSQPIDDLSKARLANAISDLIPQLEEVRHARHHVDHAHEHLEHETFLLEEMLEEFIVNYFQDTVNNFLTQPDLLAILPFILGDDPSKYTARLQSAIAATATVAATTFYEQLMMPTPEPSKDLLFVVQCDDGARIDPIHADIVSDVMLEDTPELFQECNRRLRLCDRPATVYRLADRVVVNVDADLDSDPDDSHGD